MTKNFDERIIDRGFHTGYEVNYVTIPEHDYEYLKYRDRLADDYEGENKRIRQMKYHEAYEQGKFDTNMKVWYEMPKLEQQNKRYREVFGHMRRIILHPFSKTINKYETLYKIETILRELEGEE